ncbi:glutathione transferase GstA [Candidatus Methylospira mobilis]|uniref:Glutathione transferase GstA n=1 Tax=Candidatus Methylospira mobilis TaxID=1808979 RepID=A0A5Q0BCR0_9GAMM|nr:glutathione transferase GstA [Candidatus Methylospira mobilis]QFY41655.1 glutathione transferase GstA [Candidatus Methylospira mobilis]WNV05093.1 glutathione transferase GstA [Candidatus Methylospira mobilis]
MKLYYTPGSCSLSPHIVLNEAGYEFDLIRVDLKSKTTEKGDNFNLVNTKSMVPVLELDNGELLTEGVAIVQYLADQKPETDLVPQHGTLEKARLQEWLNYISTELHKTYTPIFRAEEVGERARDYYLQKLKDNFNFVSARLKNKHYLMGDKFTVADACLFTTLSWHKAINLDISDWPVLADYQQRVTSRPQVQLTLIAEGLLATQTA